MRAVSPLRLLRKLRCLGGYSVSSSLFALGICHLSALHIAFLAFRFRQSPVNIMSWCVNCRICFRFFTTGSPAGYMSFLTTEWTTALSIHTHVKGVRYFPLSWINRNLKLALTKHRFILIFT